MQSKLLIWDGHLSYVGIEDVNKLPQDTHAWQRAYLEFPRHGMKDVKATSFSMVKQLSEMDFERPCIFLVLPIVSLGYQQLQLGFSDQWKMLLNIRGR